MKRLTLYIVLPVMALLAAFLFWFTGRVPDSRTEIVVTIPYTENIRGIDTNYYKRWLEEQTGLSIRFNIIRDTQPANYLRSMFSSGYVKSDAFFSILDDGDYTGWNAVIQEFGEKGYILPLNGYIDESVHLNRVFEEFTDYDLRAAITSGDGNIYYLPGLDPSASESNFQVLRLNESWIKKLGLRIPRTTEEFRAVLQAFKDGDPNGNGLADEIPLAGSRDVPGEQIYNFIINAFVYNDPANSRLYMDGGTVRFAPVTDEWREAMQYLNGLYADGLIDPFSYDHNVLTGLANDTWNMLGGFASRSVTDVLFPANAELVNDFIHIAPLAGPGGERNATVRTPLPRPAGVITSACEDPEAVFKLFDLMMSEEAFLIGRYGEENVDWVPAGIVDKDFFGNNATISVINQLQDTVQNKHLCEIGPFFAYPEYVDGVTFASFGANSEYVNARASRLYGQYQPAEYLRPINFNKSISGELEALRTAIDAYTDESTRAFITGDADPFSDAAWAAHLRKYQELGVQGLMDAVTEELP
jgi:ABC-type glycerol-3-phosphate transport system substrate-binding protein